jgi:hypothetical protein
VRLFNTKGIDVLAVISRLDTEKHYTYNRNIYAFTEKSQVDIYSVNKTASTGQRLGEAYEQELRRIITTYPITGLTLRGIENVTPANVDLGYANIYCLSCVISYKRANDAYSTSGASITYGNSQANTYYFPNVLNIDYSGTNNDIYDKALGRVGQLPQILGGNSMVITITCDPFLDSKTYTWKRSQTGAKTDTSNIETFIDLWHNAAASSTQKYQTLKTPEFPNGFKVRLGIHPQLDGENQKLTLTFTEYVTANAASLTYKQRLGIP